MKKKKVIKSTKNFKRVRERNNNNRTFTEVLRNDDQLMNEIAKRVVDNNFINNVIIKNESTIVSAITGFVDDFKQQDRQAKKIKEKKIKAEIKKVKKYMIDINILEGWKAEDKHMMTYEIINRYAFLKITLDDMEEEINRHGLTNYYTNKASETNMVKNPLISEYQKYLKEMQNIIKTLKEIIFGKDETKEKDAFGTFMEKAGKK